MRRGENQCTRGKTSQSREENQQTQLTYDAEYGNRTQATLVGGECSHRYATTALNDNNTNNKDNDNNNIEIYYNTAIQKNIYINAKDNAAQISQSSK